MAGIKLGKNAKLYYRSAGNFASPTWTEISSIRDLTLDTTWDRAEANSRASSVKKGAKTLLGIGFTGSIKSSDTDAAFTAVVTALLSPSDVLDVLVLNGSDSTNGARGFRYEADVYQGNENQDITTAIYLDVGFEPSALSDNAAQSVLVTNSAPVFTTL